jgi:phosphoserine phosphatase RsbU/P
VDTTACARSRSRGIAVPQYIALALVLVAVLVYEGRYVAYRYPNWFHANAADYPFLVLPDPDQPQFLAYVFAGNPVPGIRYRDIVVRVNDVPVTGSAVFGEAFLGAHPGDMLHIAVRSADNGEHIVNLRLARAVRPNPFTSGSGPFTTGAGLFDSLLFIVLPLFALGLGFWVTAVRPRDPRAWLLLAFMLSFAAFINPGVEFWRPGLRDYGATYQGVISGCFTLWMVLFGLYFPEPFPASTRWSRLDRLKWILIVPLVAIVMLDTIVRIGAVENYSAVFPVQRFLSDVHVVIDALNLVAVGLMFVSLAVKFRTATSTDARRRLRVLFAGSFVSLGPLLVLLIVSRLLGVQLEQYFPKWLYYTVYVCFYGFAPALAYVILVHRAMDVRVVLRQGLQYALARRGVRALRVLTGVALGAAMLFVMNHFGARLASNLTVVVAIAIWIASRRILEALGAWVDRRFFREAYNAEQLLLELSDNVRSIIEPQPLLATVAERISQSLHVPRIAVLTDASSLYQPAYAIGFDRLPEVAFARDATTVFKLRESREPARVYLDDPNSWIYRTPGMTEQERTRLATLHSELLLPLSAKDKLLGFISLGQKRSEEPYSPTDLRLLQSLALQTGLALEVARLTSEVRIETARRERFSRELEIAREVQERLFPQQLPVIAGLEYGGACRPALGVGGDYYDFLPLAGGRLGIALGDVSGKGIAAALTMASLQASLRAEVSRESSEVGCIVGAVNRLLHGATAQSRYATFFYAQYDPARCDLVYVNAGHNPPMLFRRNQANCDPNRLEVGGAVVGLLPGAPYTHATVTLGEGDLLVLFTDGITETMNTADEEWGESRLICTIEECKDSCPRDIMAHIMRAADQFAAGSEQHDDMTLVVLRVGAR